MNATPEPLEQLFWEIRRLFRELTAAADRELRVVGIETRDRAFLEFLAKETEPISMSDLARKYSISRQHIHQTLRRLPNREWVDEIASPSDRRTVLLRLSRKGRAHWDKIREIDKAFLNQLAAGLSQKKLRIATGVVKQIRRELAPEKEAMNE